MKVATGKGKGVRNLSQRRSWRERDDIHVEKCSSSKFTFILSSLCCPLQICCKTEIYNTLDSKIIFTYPSITLSNLLLDILCIFLILSFSSSWLFSCFSHFLSIFSSTSFAIRTLPFTLYLPHLFDFTTYIANEKRRYKWVRLLLKRRKAYFCMKYDPKELNI